MLFAVDAITTTMFGIVLWVALPETRPTVPAHDSADGGAVRAILRDHLFLAVCFLTLGFCLIFFQAFVGLPIDMRAHGISTSGFGGLIAINGVLIVVLQPFAGELIRDRSRPLVLALASLAIGVGFGLNAWVGTALGYAGAIPVWTIGEILFAPASTSLVADLAPAHLRGRYQGAFAVRVHCRIRRRTGRGWVHHRARRCTLALDRLLCDRCCRRDRILHAQASRSRHAVTLYEAH